jgi:hypothetical protein
MIILVIEDLEKINLADSEVLNQIISPNKKPVRSNTDFKASRTSLNSAKKSV